MNSTFRFSETEMEGVYEITPFCSDDIRGSFIKDYSKEIFKNLDIDYNIKEIFYAENHKGVIRGLHFQREQQQPKLVRCISGSIFDVVVDLRKNSNTLNQWKGFYLTGENRKEILIPAGYAHGYLALEESIVSYKCAEKYYSEYDDGIIWDDKDINIQWPLEKIQGDIILSDKDKQLQSFYTFRKLYGSL